MDNSDQVKASAPQTTPTTEIVGTAGGALGSEICARYGVDPGVVRSTSGFGLGRDLSRFAASRVNLLPALQQRLTAVNAEPSAAAQLDRVWFTQPPAIASPRIAAAGLPSHTILAASSPARHAMEPLPVLASSTQAPLVQAPSVDAISPVSSATPPSLRSAKANRSPATISGDAGHAPSEDSPSPVQSLESHHSVEPSAAPANAIAPSAPVSRAAAEPTSSAAPLPPERQNAIVHVPSVTSAAQPTAPIMERPIFKRGMRHGAPVDRQAAESQPASSPASAISRDTPVASRPEQPAAPIASSVAPIVHRTGPAADAHPSPTSPAEPDSHVVPTQSSPLQTTAPQSAETDAPPADAAHPVPASPATHTTDSSQDLQPTIILAATDVPVSNSSASVPRIHRQASAPPSENTATSHSMPQPAGSASPAPASANAAAPSSESSAEATHSSAHQAHASAQPEPSPHNDAAVRDAVDAASSIASVSAELPPQTWPQTILDLRGGKANPALHPAPAASPAQADQHPTALVYADPPPTSQASTPQFQASSSAAQPSTASTALEASPSTTAASFPDPAATSASGPNASQATGEARTTVQTIMRPPQSAPPPAVIHRQALPQDAIARTIPLSSVSTSNSPIDSRYLAARNAPYSAAISPYTNMPAGSSGVHRSVTPPPSITLQRSAAGSAPGSSSAVAPDPSFAASFPMPSAGAQSSEPAVNVKQLADNVYELLVERLASERQRRGA